MLKIQLFGPGTAHFDKIPLGGFPNQQACLLFCFLILNPEKLLTRDQVAALFWDNCTSSTSRKYLRNTIWRLKKLLENTGVDYKNFLRINEESICFVQTDDLWVDIFEFQKADQESKNTNPEALNHKQVKDLETAAGFYKGDLLEGIYEDWTLYDRENLRIVYLNIRQKLMLHHGHYQRYEKALEQGQQILAIDPAREKIHRHLIRLYAHAGDRTSAMAQYKRCKQILKEEFDLQPMRETRLLYQNLKKDRFDIDSMPLEGAQQTSPGVLKKLHKLQSLTNRIHSELSTLEKLLNQNPIDLDS